MGTELQLSGEGGRNCVYSVPAGELEEKLIESFLNQPDTKHRSNQIGKIYNSLFVRKRRRPIACCCIDQALPDPAKSALKKRRAQVVDQAHQSSILHQQDAKQIKEIRRKPYRGMREQREIVAQ